jgi:hypothetical protein
MIYIGLKFHSDTKHVIFCKDILFPDAERNSGRFFVEWRKVLYICGKIAAAPAADNF